MPISGTAITTSIIANGATSLNGPQFRKIAKVVGKSVATWIKLQTNVLIIGSTNGAAGGGPVTGKLFFVPVLPAMTAGFAASGLIGPSARKLSFAISKGVFSSLSATAGYRGQSTGAIGADICKVTFANYPTLFSILRANMGSQRLFGISASALCNAIATGIIALVMTGFGTGVAAGPAGPVPSTGISRSKVF